MGLELVLVAVVFAPEIPADAGQNQDEKQPPKEMRAALRRRSRSIGDGRGGHRGHGNRGGSGGCGRHRSRFFSGSGGVVGLGSFFHIAIGRGRGSIFRGGRNDRLGGGRVHHGGGIIAFHLVAAAGRKQNGGRT